MQQRSISLSKTSFIKVSLPKSTSAASRSLAAAWIVVDEEQEEPPRGELSGCRWWLVQQTAYGRTPELHKKAGGGGKNSWKDRTAYMYAYPAAAADTPWSLPRHRLGMASAAAFLNPAPHNTRNALISDYCAVTTNTIAFPAIVVARRVVFAVPFIKRKRQNESTALLTMGTLP
ncbi:hypothetical protein Zmor_001379 [Zophobas morio]|uniref:Uncharacterized protein n=1 Tax=Zophobas morio TaxID=2755281 RepID=A0AA38MP98_9CUCU|nr:hypothetical protein Zmor_001379 [Zophobas morio]